MSRQGLQHFNSSAKLNSILFHQFKPILYNSKFVQFSVKLAVFVTVIPLPSLIPPFFILFHRT